MAYQTGTSTSPADLLSKIQTFAAAQGWTINKSWSDTDGSKLLLQSGSQYVGLLAATDDIYIAGATGLDTGLDWNAQPGTSPQGRSNHMTGPYTAYHLFGDVAGYIHCVVEVTSGIFKHHVFGSLDTYGTVSGGAYVGAIYWDDYWQEYPVNSSHAALFDYGTYPYSNRGSFVRADIDGLVDNWAPFTYISGGAGQSAAGPARGNGFCMGLQTRSPNTINGLTPLVPIYVLIERASDLYSPMGGVPDMRFCNCSNITPGDIITIGTDDWIVFPFIQKNGLGDRNPTSQGTTPTSGTYAWAYKKVP